MFAFNAFRRRRRDRAENQNNGAIHNEKPCVRIVSRSKSRSSYGANHPSLPRTPLGMTDIDQTMPFLYPLARSWAWEAVTFRCHTHPEEASAEYRDYLGDTILHWAAFGKPPVATVQALLTACPDTARVANHRGLLPLHVACSYRASAAVITAILQAYPAAAAINDSSGSCPLHCMCDYGGDTGLGDSALAVAAILQCDAGMASVMMKSQRYHRRPLYILNARKNLRDHQRDSERIRNTRLRQRLIRKERREDWPEQVQLQHELLEVLEAEVRPMEHTEFWRKVSLLAVAEYQHILAQDRKDITTPRLPFCLLFEPENSEDASLKAEQQSTILHACVGNPDCPPALQEYATLLYEPHLSVPDDRGRLPLHLAAATYSLPSVETSSQLLIALLDACPEAARVRDKNGCLPLSLALRRQRQKNAFRNDRAECIVAVWTEGLGTLINANPLALLEEDIFIFGEDCRNDDNCNINLLYSHVFARLSVNALFTIGQANPTLLTRCLPKQIYPL